MNINLELPYSYSFPLREKMNKTVIIWVNYFNSQHVKTFLVHTNIFMNNSWYFRFHQDQAMLLYINYSKYFSLIIQHIWLFSELLVLILIKISVTMLHIPTNIFLAFNLKDRKHEKWHCETPLPIKNLTKTSRLKKFIGSNISPAFKCCQSWKLWNEDQLSLKLNSENITMGAMVIIMVITKV